jgi:hypothetical protein
MYFMLGLLYLIARQAFPRNPPFRLPIDADRLYNGICALTYRITTSISSISHENIARRAHQIWEETGRRNGNETTHWLQAEKELRAHGETTSVNAERERSVEPPMSGKHASEHARHSTNDIRPGVATDSLHHVRNR